MTCHDLDPDSRYVFRLTGTTTTHTNSNTTLNAMGKEKTAAVEDNHDDQANDPSGEETKEREEKEEKEEIVSSGGSSKNSGESGRATPVEDTTTTSTVAEETTPPIHTDAPTVSFGLISAKAAAALQPLRRSNTLTAETLSEMLFMLDPSSCGSNLVLSNGNLVVTNTVSKTQSMYMLLLTVLS